jgi:hypothetical protein
MKKSDSRSQQVKALVVSAVLASSCGLASAQITLGGGSLVAKTGTVTYNNLNSSATIGNSWSGGALSLTDGTSNFYAYCIDPLTSGTGGSGTYSTASLSNFLTAGSPTGYTQEMTSAGYTGLAYVQQNTTIVNNALVSLFSHAYSDSLQTNVKAAAFSYAVWEIMGDSSTQSGTGTYSRTAGALRGGGSTAATDSDATEAQIDSYLSALNSGNWSGLGLSTTTNYVYTVYYDPAPHSAQNFLSVTTAGVPEPGSIALVGAAMLGVAVSRRRRTKHA